ncbi:MAG: tetratricopeptide repeat protein [Cyanobacteria bacterium SZAS LIN-3]|nr:tetratricopeptide repeat protein [Cyanobacteria bacterium SZAS LIN-3]
MSEGRKSKRTTLGQISVLTFMFCAGQASVGSLIPGASSAALAISSSEDQVLSRWKQTAESTSMGAALLQILNDCNRSLAINSLNARASFRRGYLFGILGCTYSAISDLSRTIAITPSDSRAYTERALCYMDLRQYDRALVDLNRALQLQPNSGNARLARARLALATGRPQWAIEDLRNCQGGNVSFEVELPGEYSANHYNAVSYYLGTAYEAMGQTGPAISAYKESLKIADPTPGYLHRYAEQPGDGKQRLAHLQHSQPLARGL